MSAGNCNDGFEEWIWRSRKSTFKCLCVGRGSSLSCGLNILSSLTALFGPCAAVGLLSFEPSPTGRVSRTPWLSFSEEEYKTDPLSALWYVKPLHDWMVSEPFGSFCCGITLQVSLLDLTDASWADNIKLRLLCSDPSAVVLCACLCPSFTALFCGVGAGPFGTLR